MPPQYRPPANANTVYFYKDGPLTPDPELSGEEQLAQQAAYIASFARFEEENDDAAVNEEMDGADGSVSDDDMFDEDGEMEAVVDDEAEYDDAPLTKEPPSEIMAEILKEEKRAVSWQAISDDLDDVLNASFGPHFLAASEVDISYNLRETREIDPNNHKDGEPSLNEFDFPRYWNYTMDILAKEHPKPQSRLYPIQGHWKITFADDPALEYDKDQPIVLRPDFTIDLQLMFEMHNERLQTILKERGLLPSEGLRDEDWKLLILKPTAEDAQHFAEILLMESMAGSWIATSNLLRRIQEVYMTCGPPPMRQPPVTGEPHLLVVEDDLDALVKLYHFYREQAEPELQAMRFDRNQKLDKHKKKEIANLVERVIRMREPVRRAKDTEGGGLFPKSCRDVSAKTRERVPRKHPIHPALRNSVGRVTGFGPNPGPNPDWSSERWREKPWPSHDTIEQTTTTHWTSPEAKARYQGESSQRAQAQRHSSMYTADGALKPHDAFEDWCNSMPDKAAQEADDPEQSPGTRLGDSSSDAEDHSTTASHMPAQG